MSGSLMTHNEGAAREGFNNAVKTNGDTKRAQLLYDFLTKHLHLLSASLDRLTE